MKFKDTMTKWPAQKTKHFSLSTKSGKQQDLAKIQLNMFVVLKKVIYLFIYVFIYLFIYLFIYKNNSVGKNYHLRWVND